ncbi:hypothetical protein V1525DRAFT_62433 [Lipomyces kononenkoae]|uniref:Uncharacterized protein n=1 Tax=Lipomyces kononenkoae TaxID=34357 RepID=A0ACC3T566_LIPKO
MQQSMPEPHDQPTSTTDDITADSKSTLGSFGPPATIPLTASAAASYSSSANATLATLSSIRTNKGPLQFSGTSNSMSADSSTQADNDDGLPARTVIGTLSATASDAAAAVSEAIDPSSQKPQASAAGQQMPSQRACTQCQRHKIKCVFDGLGPCVRCRKKGFLCHIAPRKKRVSKKNSGSASSARSPAGSSRAGRDSLYDAESDDDEIMDESDSHHADPQIANRSGSVIGGSSGSCGSVHFSGTTNGNLNINPTCSAHANEIAGHDGKTNSINGNNGSVWLSPESMVSTPPGPTPPHASRLPEFMKQSTISSCSEYSIYLSLSFVCPELFRRIVDMDWHQNPVLFDSPVNNTRPLFRSLVDSPTSPVYGLAFPNDPGQMARYNLPCSAEDEQTVAAWRKQYGPVLIDLYFNLINPTQPIIHRRHFMAAYDANKESVILLLAIFAVSVPNCTLGTPDDRRTLQTKFIQHLLAHYSYKLMMPTFESVQALSLIADSSADRGVLMPHAALVAAAVELRLHMDCSLWNIPDWERALRKALWHSICIRDAWTVVRFVGTPKVMSEYYDAPLPTTAELSQLTMKEGEDLSVGSCIVLVNQSRINVSMESCLRSFISVADLSEILLLVNRSLYQLKGIRFLHQQPAAAASHIAESLESRLQELAASWPREESALMEPDLYRWIMFHFVRICIYSQFLPHKQLSMHADRFQIEFYTRFLDATQGCIDFLNKLKNVKFSNYWPPWLNHLVIIHMFVLYDVLIAIICRYFKAHGVPTERSSTDAAPHADEPRQPKKHVPMPQAQRRALLLEILNKDRFSARVLQYSSDLMVTIGDLAASWDHARELYKMMLKMTRSVGLTDVIDAPGMVQYMQQCALDAAKSQSESGQSQQRQGATQCTSQPAAQQQTPPSQYSTPQLGVFQPARLNTQQPPSPSLQTASPAQSHTLQPQQPHGATSCTLLPPVYHLPTVGPLQNNYNPSLQSLMAQPNGKLVHLPQSVHQPPQSSSYDIAQILNHEQPDAQQPQQQQQQSGFVGQFGGRMQQNLYEEAAGITNASPANSSVQNVPVAGDNVAGIGGTHAIGAFDDFFTNLSANLFEGLGDIQRDFIF